MGFVPEDGNGLANATSLVDLAYANSYWSDRPRAAAGKWADATDPQKQEALMRATQRLCSLDWKGTPINGTQALSLPRYWPYDDPIDGRYWDSIPTPVKDACCELANEDLAEILDSSLDRGGDLASEKIGPLEFHYNPSAPSEKVYPRVENLIAKFLDDGGSELLLS